MTDVLRAAIVESGIPYLRIARETGVERLSISRFARGTNSLHLDSADKLAAYFGIKVSMAKRRR